MSEVTKVFMGASALLRNGSVLSRVGSASVALAAHSSNIPVLICCETFKLTNRVLLDSITQNELGDPETVRDTDNNGPEGQLDNWKEISSLKLLTLKYDVCPSQYVSGTITEYGILPPTSVAVLLREINADDVDFDEL